MIAPLLTTQHPELYLELLYLTTRNSERRPPLMDSDNFLPGFNPPLQVVDVSLAKQLRSLLDTLANVRVVEPGNPAAVAAAI